jgi:hypothetical protein
LPQALRAFKVDCLRIYLDESGDLGFHFEKKGTSRYFIITLLVCYDEMIANNFKKAVRRTLKNKLKTKKARLIELKGTDTTLAVKKYFYQNVSNSNGWHLYGIVLDKHLLKSKLISVPNERRIYNYLSKEILRQVSLIEIKSRLLLVVDKRKGAKGINEFNRYLSSHLEAMLPLNVQYNISHEKSHESPILQAVDMFCWGIRRSYELKDDSWLEVFQDKLTLIQVDDFLSIKKDGP